MGLGVLSGRKVRKVAVSVGTLSVGLFSARAPLNFIVIAHVQVRSNEMQFAT